MYNEKWHQNIKTATAPARCSKPYPNLEKGVILPVVPPCCAATVPRLLLVRLVVVQGELPPGVSQCPAPAALVGTSSSCGAITMMREKEVVIHEYEDKFIGICRKEPKKCTVGREMRVETGDW